MYAGERVTLSCGFGGDPAGWEYLWYKDRLRDALPNTDSSRTNGSSYTISSAALTHSGEYRCIAARGRESFYSDYSDPLTIDISEGQGKKELDGGEFYSRVNADYISAGHGFPTDAVYEEIDPTTETEGSAAAVGQHSLYSVIQLKPLNQGSLIPDPHGQSAAAGPHAICGNPATIPHPTAGVPSLIWTPRPG
ncbi:hypothetical protein SKAU_G00104120 [Synaphobranchus kaupii]|uniref:Ig-like domain-containing protein n=1 Tax=Synaphobranchus kaupii TaxID=118154 RepID=A0A9Q1J7E5_SYNKA|nr:hypothetical protein SKAU_G00104120 [Synaphobranchus kaupii]